MITKLSDSNHIQHNSIRITPIQSSYYYFQKIDNAEEEEEEPITKEEEEPKIGPRQIFDSNGKLVSFYTSWGDPLAVVTNYITF
jgi:hypothetical protein